MPIEQAFWGLRLKGADDRRERGLVRQRQSEGRDYVEYQASGDVPKEDEAARARARGHPSGR